MELGQRVFQANTLVALPAKYAKKYAAYLMDADEIAEEAIATPGYTRAISKPGSRSKSRQGVIKEATNEPKKTSAKKK